jgi:hypothetical protein
VSRVTQLYSLAPVYADGLAVGICWHQGMPAFATIAVGIDLNICRRLSRWYSAGTWRVFIGRNLTTAPSAAVIRMSLPTAVRTPSVYVPMPTAGPGIRCRRRPSAQVYPDGIWTYADGFGRRHSH